MSTSQTQAILNYLSDGQERTVAEIHRACGYSRLNSRVSDLRKRGYVIVCEHHGGKGASAYSYRMLAEPDQGEQLTRRKGLASSATPEAHGPTQPGSPGSANIPVMIDEAVAPGVAELRNGDEVVAVLRLFEAA